MSIFKNAPFNLELDRPLYQQLYSHIRAAILSGELKGGMRLPSTRGLADELSISRNTVLNAYGQLLTEGYVESVGGSGTYVTHVLPDLLLTTPQHKIIADIQRKELGQPQFSEIAKSLLATPSMASVLPKTRSGVRRPFTIGMPALDAFPREIWSRLLVRQARRISTRTFYYQELAGYRPLREAIALHVTVARQVHCTPEQIIITSGSQGALDLAVRTLVNVGDPVWLEDPGYLGARGALLAAGAQIIPVPIDDEGLVVEAGIARAPQARLAYLTPSHQFPLGVTMSLARRLTLLDWAKRANAYILEDDYDSEYRFSERPLAALQGLDDAERVIYIGTFSKVLFPALRVGYLVLPPSLVDPFLAVRFLIDIHTPILEQAALADFMAEGHFNRHLRRMRILYAERHTALLDAIRELPLEVQSPGAGIHCTVWLPVGMDALALVQRAVAHDVSLFSVSQFSIEPLVRQGLILGYGGYSVEEIRDGVRGLAASMRSV